MTITQERLRELLSYDPTTGDFTWRATWSPRAVIGTVAGCLEPEGYRLIGVDRKMYRAHQLVWLYCHGCFGRPMLDHINGKRDDNRIANLRIADRRINAQNLRRAQRTSRTGLMGVHKEPGSKSWQARIKVNGKYIHIGTFATPEEAHAAYVVKKREVHAGCTI